jgi:hypothetical protein
MSKNRHRAAFLPRTRSLGIILPGIALAAILLGAVPWLERRAADESVIYRTVTELPKLDTGVRQAVHATFVGDTKPALGQPASLKLVVTSGANGAEVRTHIAMPEGAALSKGYRDWDGRLDYEQAAEIPVSVLLPGDRGGFVRAEVSTVLPNGQEFRSATAVYVDPGDPDSPVPEPVTLIEPDGSTLDVVIYRPSNQ